MANMEFPHTSPAGILTCFWFGHRFLSNILWVVTILFLHIYAVHTVYGLHGYIPLHFDWDIPATI